MKLSEKIKEFRLNNDMTQEELSEKLFVTRQAVSKWEQGKSYPSVATMGILSKLMGVTVDDLLSSEESKVMALNANESVIRGKKKSYIAIGFVAMIFAVFVIIFFAVILPGLNRDDLPALKNVIGMYIDTDLSDGEITLDGSNDKDVYYYVKRTSAIGFKTCGVGILPEAVQSDMNISQNYNSQFVTIHNIDNTCYNSMSGTVYLDRSKVSEFQVYLVLQRENLELYTEKHMSGAADDTGIWSKVGGITSLYTASDYRDIGDHRAGYFMSLGVRYMYGFDDLRLTQFDSKIEKFPELYTGEYDDNLISDETVLFEYNLTSTNVSVSAPIYSNTISSALYKVTSRGGTEVRELYEAFTEPVSVFTGEILKPSEHGYVEKAWKFGGYRTA